jgi:hypothetical protein
MSDAAEWLIKKRGYYYRADKAGYTARLEDAGLYTEADAKAEARIEPEVMSAHHISEFRPLRTKGHTMINADELKRLMGEATPGPWKMPDDDGKPEYDMLYDPDEFAAGGHMQCAVWAEGAQMPVLWAWGECFPCGREQNAGANAALIVAAVNALPELLAENGRMRSALQAIVDNAAISDDAALFRAQAAAHARAALKEPGQ